MNEQELLEAYKEKCPHAWKILEEKIRKEERWRFAEWLDDENVLMENPYIMLAEYEKRQK